MSYSQHSSARNRKAGLTSPPYCRRADWWKNPDSESEETPAHRHVVKKSGYLYLPKSKTWSIVLLASGSQGLRESGKKSPSAKLEAEFNNLVKQWKEETFSLSSLTKIYAHPAYQRIMAMGTAGIPFVLKELQKDQGHWFYALKFMAGTNVSAGMNNFEDAKAAWVAWGYKNNYI